MEEEEDIELSDLLSEFTDLDFAGDQNVQSNLTILIINNTSRR